MISVCIATFKRPEKLLSLLVSLVKQDLTEMGVEIIIIDNDLLQSAKLAVQNFAEMYPEKSIVYGVEPVQNIALARNRSVSLSKGEYIAFIDDDEEASPHWLRSLLRTMLHTNADAVAGPVLAVLPDNAPEWVRKGRFFERPQYAQGTIITWARTGNILVKREWFKNDTPFDPALGLTGGEDTDFFARIRTEGAVICWSEDGVVSEKVDPDRMQLKWLLMRAFRGGQVFSEKMLDGKGLLYKSIYIAYRSFLSVFALLMSIVSIPLGMHCCVWWLRKVFSSLGQISVILPYRYAEYNVSAQKKKP